MAASTWLGSMAPLAHADAALAEIGLELYDSDAQRARELLSGAISALGNTRMEEARQFGLSQDSPAAATMSEQVFGDVRAGDPRQEESP